MANQHSTDKQPIYVRFHKDFVAEVKAAAAANGEPLQDLVERALRAKMEAGETRTEWGVRSGEYVDAHPTGQSARTEVRRYGGDLMRRPVGPWVPVEDEAVDEVGDPR